MWNFISSLAYLARSFFSSFQLSLSGKYIGSNRFADNSRCFRNVVVNNIELGKLVILTAALMFLMHSWALSVALVKT